LSTFCKAFTSSILRAPAWSKKGGYIIIKNHLVKLQKRISSESHENHKLYENFSQNPSKMYKILANYTGKIWLFTF
jgi:hypothetical protein